MSTVGALLPQVRYRAVDSTGAPLDGAKLYAYAAGSALSTPQDTFSDSALTTPNTNPVVSASDGLFGPIYLSPLAYQFQLTDAAGNVIWTQDNVFDFGELYGINIDITGTAGASLSAGEVVYLKTDGLWYQTDADATATSTDPIFVGMVPAAISSAASGKIRLSGRVTGLSGLVAGTTYYVSSTTGALTSTAPTNARIVGVADTTTSLVLGAVPSALGLVTIAKALTVTGAAALNGGATFPDSIAATFGTGSDATVKYDGTNLLINPQVVGSGATVLSAGDFYTTAWTNYGDTSTVVGWSSFTTKQIYYRKIGTFVWVSFVLDGTSDATTATFTLPVASAAAPAAYRASSVDNVDNGSGVSTPGGIFLPASSSTVTLFKASNGTAWTAANQKKIQGQFFYQAAS